RALSGSTGRPVAGASVSLYRVEWNPQGVERESAASSDDNGFATLPVRVDPHQYRQRFLYAQSGDDLALETNAGYWEPAASQPPATSALVFTDRSIYRPTQTIFWKALAYKGDAKEGRLRVAPQTAVTVSLMDANHQTVASRTATTNEFGSAAG